MNARRDVGELLANQLDSMQDELAARALPFAEALDMRQQRDRARRWAVALEQECADLRDQIDATREWVAAGPCDCPSAAWTEADPDRDPCERCILLSYLAPRPTLGSTE